MKLDNINSNLISEVQVKGLFGRYNYSLKSPDSDNHDDSKLLILYGDNGSGKTTLLNLIFNLMAPPGLGHKTYLARSIFNSLRVTLFDGTQVSAVRAPDSFSGDYVHEIKRPRRKLISVQYEFIYTTDGANVRAMDKKGEDLLKDYFSESAIPFHFLTDDRKYLISDVEEGRESNTASHWNDTLDDDFSRTIFHINSRRDAQQPRILELSIEKAESWLRNIAQEGAESGLVQANTIYAEVLKRLSSSAPKGDQHTGDKNSLLSRIASLSKRNETFLELGLAPYFETEAMVKSITRSKPETFHLISDVISPYIDGIEARLDALQDTHDTVRLFIDNINSLFNGKTVTFDLRNGLKIYTSNKKRLEPNQLSSGEKQLLLVLCNALSARNKATVFVIDEPEISLNIVWQRRVAKVILDCLQNRSAQVILATHSIELISQYRNRIVRLKNRHV